MLKCKISFKVHEKYFVAYSLLTLDGDVHRVKIVKIYWFYSTYDFCNSEVCKMLHVRYCDLGV